MCRVVCGGVWCEVVCGDMCRVGCVEWCEVVYGVRWCVVICVEWDV